MTQRVPVPIDLQPWIEMAVVVRADVTLGLSRFPALAGSQLVLRLSGQVHTQSGLAVPAAALLGPTDGPTAYRHQGAVHAVGLVLWPHAAPVLMRAEGCDLAGRALALDDVLDAPARHLHAALQDTGDDATRLARLFDWVRTRVHTPAAQHQLAQRLRLAHAVSAGLPDAPATLGLSRRHLQRRFAQAFGLPSKTYLTLQRLKAALHDGVSGRLDGAALALAHGYYDQSHLARDLRRLAGEPLASLRAPALAQRPEHWALQLGAGALSRP